MPHENLILEKVGLTDDSKIEKFSPVEFFKNRICIAFRQNGEEKKIAESYAEFYSFFIEGLSGLMFFKAGEARKEVCIVRLQPQGGIVGLKSVVVKT